MIESQFSILLEKVETTHDFEAIRFAHDQFLTALLSQAFLLMKPVCLLKCKMYRIHDLSDNV